MAADRGRWALISRDLTYTPTDCGQVLEADTRPLGHASGHPVHNLLFLPGRASRYIARSPLLSDCRLRLCSKTNEEWVGQADAYQQKSNEALTLIVTNPVSQT